MKAIQKSFRLKALMALMVALVVLNVQAQVRIGEDAAPVKGAVLDLSSSPSGYVGGLKLPNVALSSLTAIPATFKESVTTTAEKADLKGTIVYNTFTSAPANIFPGIYYWDGTQWVPQSTTTTVVAGTAPVTVASATAGSTTTYTVGITPGTADNQVLKWDNTNKKWVLGTDDNTISNYSAGNGLGLTYLYGADTFEWGGGPLKRYTTIENAGYALNFTGTGVTTIATPTTISGNLQISSGSPGAGKVLTSDASGNATWSTSYVSNVTSTAPVTVTTSGTTRTVAVTTGNLTANAASSSVRTATNPLTIDNGTARLVTGNTVLTVNNTAPIWDANEIMGRGIAITVPTAGQVLTWDANGFWEPKPPVAAAAGWLLGGNSLSSIQNLGTTSAHDLPFITSNSEKMRLTTSGFLGIGTTAPTRGLHLSGTSNKQSILMESTSSSYPEIKMATTTTASGTTMGRLLFTRVDPFATNSAFIEAVYKGRDGSGFFDYSSLEFTTSTGGSSDALAKNPYMVLNQYGWLGIGTRDPKHGIEVVAIGDDSKNNVAISSYTGSSGPIANPYYVGSFCADAYRGTPSFPANIASQDRIGGVRFRGQVGGSLQFLAEIEAGYVGNGTTKDATLSFLTGGNQQMIIDATGNVGIGTATPSQKLHVNGNVLANNVSVSSDERWKKDIVTISNPLSIVNQLRGTSYEFRADEFPEKRFSEGKQLGVIAQEVEKVLPELVKTDNEGYKSVNYEGIIPVLIEGMKAQQTQIELLQKVNEQLEARLKALEAAK